MDLQCFGWVGVSGCGRGVAIFVCFVFDFIVLCLLLFCCGLVVFFVLVCVLFGLWFIWLLGLYSGVCDCDLFLCLLLLGCLVVIL